MAGLALIDGSDATIDIMLNSNSFKCVASYWVARFSRQMFELTTFCSSGWRAPRPGMKAMRGTIAGFASYGDPSSDPLALFASSFQSTGVAFTLTAHTGCTLTGNCHVSESDVGFRAAGPSEAGIDFESTGPVTSTWVVV